MKAQRCKGFRDLFPVDMKRFRLVEDIFRDTCLKRGYQEIRTPTIEYLYLFTSTGTLTPSLLNRVYSFLDWDGWSGERVVLRPDGTIPVARMYIESMENETLAKLFYITNIFVFEETGKENREKWQCGVELIGAGSPLADVELISMAIEVLHLLKFKNIVLKLSHAGLIKALLAGLGLSHEEQTGLFDKILDGDIDVLDNIKPEKSVLGKTIIELLELKGNSKSLLENLKSLYASKLPEIRQPLDDFINIINLLDILNINYQIDMDTGRGFEYYTGIIFHLSINDQYVIGGGRYDALIPFMNGKDTPACGCALYLDQIMRMVIPSNFENTKSRNSCLIIVDPSLPGTVKTGFKLAEVIRNAGIKAEINLGAAHPKDYNWKIKVKEDFTFSLLNNKSTKINTVETDEDVLKLVKYERTNKNSTSKRSSSR
jgi:histidyl-tRNA synthetase